MKKMSQAHGMVDTGEEKFEPTSLDQVWGNDGTSKYDTLDVKDYKENLKEMSKSDMQAHAIKIGLIPVDDIKMLESRLIREFNKHVARYTKPLSNKSNPLSNIDKKSAQTLSEGR